MKMGNPWLAFLLMLAAVVLTAFCLVRLRRNR